MFFKANEDLMRDIEMKRKEREYENLKRERERFAEMQEFRTEELGPDGSVKTMGEN